MKLFTDPHYFQNTNKAITRRHSGKLLLVVEWATATEFVYETYSIFVYTNGNNKVTREKDRETKTNRKIIQQYFDHYLKDPHETRKVQPKDILACNPKEYPPEKIVTQRI